MKKAAKVLIILNIIFLTSLFLGAVIYYIIGFWIILPTAVSQKPFMFDIIRDRLPQIDISLFNFIREISLIILCGLFVYTVMAYFSGIYAIRKLKICKSYNEVNRAGFFALCFNNILSGIFILSLKEERINIKCKN